MDRAIFVAMKGLQNCAFGLAATSNNVANAGTVGFKSEEFILRQGLLNNQSDKDMTRIYGEAGQIYSNARVGPLIPTGGNLDVAIKDSDYYHVGFIAVQGADGQEGYTRNGSLGVNHAGLLVTNRGELVLNAAGGPISLANASEISLGPDGSVNGRERGGDHTLINFGKIKVVEGNPFSVEKTENGLYRARANQTLTPAPETKLIIGSLEGSNVNPMRELTKLIDISRSYEMQTRAMKTIQEYSNDANKLLDVAD